MSAEQHVPNKKQRELLDKHLELVIEENKVTNLTRIVDWESAQILHVEDSLAGLQRFRRRWRALISTWALVLDSLEFLWRS